VETLQSILLVAPVLLFSVVAHEVAHGWAALSQGDTTARDLGRLSWNPIKHVDPFMTVLLPVMMLVASGGKIALGGAKPVPVDPRNYRHYRRGDIIVSLAGVFTNLLVAIGCTALAALFGVLGQGGGGIAPSLVILQEMMLLGIYINWILILFNLIPLPPLDGSHVLKHLLPRRLAIAYVRFGRYGILVLAILLYLGALEKWLRPAELAARAMIGVVAPTLLPPNAAWLR
jgi:Zn-dependent protease